MSSHDSRPALIESAQDLTRQVRVLRLLPVGGRPFSFRPGQWIILHLPGDGTPAGRHYSIASPLDLLPRIEVCIRRVTGGDGTEQVWNLRAGDRVELGGPGGSFLLRESAAGEVLFIASGTGASPFRPMVREALARRRVSRAALVLGARTREDLLFRREWEALERDNARFRFIPVLSRAEGEWRGARGYVQDAAEGLLRRRGQEIYVCGMPGMVAAVRERCAAAGIPEDRVHFERHG